MSFIINLLKDMSANNLRGINVFRNIIFIYHMKYFAGFLRKIPHILRGMKQRQHIKIILVRTTAAR
jgi:hypothetical protein